MSDVVVKDCEWCNLSDEDKQYLLYEDEYWMLFLADEQDYVGRSILVLKRHCASMSELNEEEWKVLHNLIQRFETCALQVLGADVCNWSCLMNNFFKEEVTSEDRAVLFSRMKAYWEN